MNESELAARLEDFILVRLLAGGVNGVTLTALSKDVGKYFQHRWQGAEWTRYLDAALARLAEQGLASPIKKGKSAELTEPGRQRGLDYIGVRQLPPKTTWAKLTGTYLVAKAFGVPLDSAETAKRIASAAGVGAAIMREAYDLPVPKAPTGPQALNALLWQQLGVESCKPLTLATIESHLLGKSVNAFLWQQLGVESNKPFTLSAVKLCLLGKLIEVKPGSKPAQIAKRIPGRIVGARQNTADGIRAAVLRTFVNSGNPIPMAENSTNTQPPPLPSPPEPQVWELAQFAREILAAARACREGRFGPDKVFIAYAFDELRRQHPSLEMTLDEFKARLTEANHQDLLTLTRADLVQVMNPRDVARSETRYLNAVFHFIRAEAQP